MSPLLVLALLSSLLVVYAIGVVALVVAGQRSDAKALATFIPDCLVLLKRLLQDPRVPVTRKLLIFGLIGYLALPIDLIPDFIPVAGQLDDAILTALVLRIVLRGGGPGLFDEHWPGPARSGSFVRRVAFGGPSGG